MKSHSLHSLFLSLALLPLSLSGEAHAQTPAASEVQAQKTPSHQKWKGELERIAKERKASPLPQGGMILTGSSTARMWKIREVLPGQSVVNHGFGGSNYPELYDLLDELVFQHQPSLVILYSGDNDVKQLNNAKDVLENAIKVYQKILDELPKAKILIVGVKPSKSRWNLYPVMKEVNEGIRSFVEKHADRVSWFDPAQSLLDDNGQVRDSDFLKDKLHLSPEGYARLNIQLKEAIEKINAPAS